MKKNLSQILAMLLLIVMISSCKKDSTPKDHTASIKGKTWWGMIAYTGQAAVYYSIHFSEDNTLIWSEKSTNYTGEWSVDGEELTISFFGRQVKADISDDNKLMNITDNTTDFIVNSGQLIPNPKQSLLNTIWKGEVNIGMRSQFQLNFISATNVELTVDNVASGSYTYTRSVSGAFIYIYTPAGVLFGVVASDTEMKGDAGLPEYSWQVVKQ